MKTCENRNGKLIHKVLQVLCMCLIYTSRISADTPTVEKTKTLSAVTNAPVDFVISKVNTDLKFTLTKPSDMTATIDDPGMGWSTAITSGDFNECSSVGKAEFTRLFTGHEHSDNLFVATVSGEIEYCEGEDGEEGGTVAYSYLLNGDISLNFYIDPQDSYIGINEDLTLNAKEMESNTPVLVDWTLEEGEETDVTLDPASGTTTTFSATKAGVYDIAANRPDDSRENTEGKTTTVNVLEVALEKLQVEEQDPQLDAGLICTNAQPEYKKARWQATVKPDGTYATVTIESGNVSFDGDPEGGITVSDGDVFYVEGDDTGEYQLKIVHQDNTEISAEAGSTVFVFIIEHDDLDWSPATVGSMSNSEENEVDARNHHQPGEQYARAEGSGFGWISTTPENVFSGKVGVKAKISTEFDGSITKVMGSRSILWKWSYNLKVKIPGLPGDFEFSTETNNRTGSAYESSTGGIRAIVNLDGASELESGEHFKNNETTTPATAFQMIKSVSYEPEMDIMLTQQNFNTYRVKYNDDGYDEIEYFIELNAGANGLGVDPTLISYTNKSAAYASLELSNLEITAHNNEFKIEDN